jgi:LPXTG-motif cell wall-anchored protein
MQKALVVLTLLGLTVVPAAAAHVEPSPEKVPAGTVAKITLSAEGEESVPAVKVTVQMAPGVTDVVAHPTPGWKQSVKGRIVTWSGGKIPDGAVGKFSFTARFPETAGKVLVFPSLVTYANGDVVHWIGAESSDTPAPRITLTQGLKAQPPPPPPPPSTTTGSATPVQNGDGDSNNWIWVLIAAAVLAALATILLVRKRRA